MSVIFNAKMRNKTFPVKFFRDGSVAFPEYNTQQYEYDTAMVEFGEEETPEIAFMEEWQTEAYNGKLHILSEFISIDPLLLVSIAADCVERALGFYESSHGRYEEVAKKILQDCRSYAITQKAEYLHKNIGDAEEVTKSMERGLTTETWRYYTGYSIYHLAGAVLFFGGKALARDYSSGSGNVRLYEAMRNAAKASAFGAIREVNETPAWSRRHKFESAWIVRRFVDTMEAVQAGRDWPPLEDTE